MSIEVVAAVAAAGALGAVARYLLSAAALSLWNGMPWHTALVNVLGCFGFGLVFAIGSSRWSPGVTTAVLAGFFGAFTTFSSFAFDVTALLREGRWLVAVADVLLQNLLGLLAMAAGIALGGGFPR
jgi:CrcB protein